MVWSSYGPTPRVARRDALNIGLGDWIGWMVASSWVDRVMVSRVAAIHVPSEKSRGQIEDRYGRNATVIPLGVDSAFFGAGDKDRAVRKHNLDDKFVLLCVGKLHPYENQIACVQAVRKLLSKLPNAFLVVAGDGPMAERWQRLAANWGIEKHVQFVGHIPGREVRDLYKACDVHLYPPVNESWGLTPFEALCAQRISVVSNDCGAAEVLAPERIGVVCEPTASAFAEQILRIYQSPIPYQRMAARGRDYVAHNLTWGRYADEVLSLFEGACPCSYPSARRTDKGKQRDPFRDEEVAK